MNVLDTIREIQDTLALGERPPVDAIYAHHSVPWGWHPVQYMTDGRKIVWVNRGELAELPPFVPTALFPTLTGLRGIPVYML